MTCQSFLWAEYDPDDENPPLIVLGCREHAHLRNAYQGLGEEPTVEEIQAAWRGHLTCWNCNGTGLDEIITDGAVEQVDCRECERVVTLRSCGHCGQDVYSSPSGWHHTNETSMCIADPYYRGRPG